MSAFRTLAPPLAAAVALLAASAAQAQKPPPVNVDAAVPWSLSGDMVPVVISAHSPIDREVTFRARCERGSAVRPRVHAAPQATSVSEHPSPGPMSAVQPGVLDSGSAMLWGPPAERTSERT